LATAEDQELWEYARQGGFVVLTKDKDFQQLSALRGAPPKVVWLRVGNRSTADLAKLVRAHATALEVFERSDQASLLILADRASA
jgi:predicted nuclease of predicted toxin-antitoxin system